MAGQPISPAEPPKKCPPPIQPNAHPYAIKTTSSALLSRSNSSPHYANHTRHHYGPSSPSQVTAGVHHRHSSSLPLVGGEVHDGVRTIPAPLSTPLSIMVASPLKRVDEPKLTHRVRRAESNITARIMEHDRYDRKRNHNHDQDSRSELDNGLAPNPKQWNTDELAAYLQKSLQSADDTDAGKENILEYVRIRGLTGRGLLRLTDGDLAGAPLSEVQRAQLLEHSRTLRADVLRGRIYVDSYHSHEVSDNSSDIYTLSMRSSTPFRNIHGPSVSADDLRLFPDNDTGEGVSACPLSPAVTLHRSNSVSDASAQRYRDLARLRMRRRGRVKGLVETWERASTSGSECSASEEGSVSASESESEIEIDPRSESILDTNHSSISSSDLPPAVSNEPPHDAPSPTTDSTGIPQEPPSLTPPPPYTHVCTAHGDAGDEDEEPTIEELLASSSDIPLKGARAWEADFGLGETVKRIPVITSADTENPSHSATEPKTYRGPKGDEQQPRGDAVRSRDRGGTGGTGSKGKTAKTQKRVVTAIFNGSPSDDVPENLGDNLVDHRREASSVNGVVCDEAAARLDMQNDSDSALRALEDSITATRAQMEALRVRLEQVEADATRQEAELTRAQYPDTAHSSGFESRQRRPEVSVQATVETAEPPTDGILVTGVEREPMSLCDITRAIVAGAMGWLLPYGRLARANSRPGVNDKYPSPAKRGGGLSLARMSCSIILVSFAICAAVLRRIGFGRWVRRP